MKSKAELFCDWLTGPNGGGSTKRPFHVLAFAKGLSDTEGSTFWAIMKEEWSGFDLVPHAEFEIQFLRFADTAPGLETLAPTRLYRGQDTDAPVGLSWTSCADVAEGFALGNRGKRYKAPVVWETIAYPEQIAFECNDREEKEYVLLSRPTHYWLAGAG